MPATTNEIPVDPDLLKHLRTDQELEAKTKGKLKACTIRSKRSRGEWPYDTIYIGRIPHTDERQFLARIVATRKPGCGEVAA